MEKADDKKIERFPLIQISFNKQLSEKNIAGLEVRRDLPFIRVLDKTNLKLKQKRTLITTKTRGLYLKII